MPLNTPVLITDFEQLYEYMQTVTDKQVGKREYARRQAAILERYVKSALVSGTGAGPNGPITFTGTLS